MSESQPPVKPDMNHLLCVLHDALSRCLEECSSELPQAAYNQATNALQTVRPYIVRTLPAAPNRDVLQLRRETASRIRDILNRIGTAYSQNWLRHQLTQIADGLEFQTVSDQQSITTAETAQ